MQRIIPMPFHHVLPSATLGGCRELALGRAHVVGPDRADFLRISGLSDPYGIAHRANKARNGPYPVESRVEYG